MSSQSVTISEPQGLSHKIYLTQYNQPSICQYIHIKLKIPAGRYKSQMKTSRGLERVLLYFLMTYSTHFINGYTNVRCSTVVTCIRSHCDHIIIITT